MAIDSIRSNCIGHMAETSAPDGDVLEAFLILPITLLWHRRPAIEKELVQPLGLKLRDR